MEQKWNKFSDNQPEIGKLVVVFRYKKKCYVVTKLEKNIGQKGNRMEWRSSSGGNRLLINENDRWTILEPVTLTETYK